MIKNTRREFRMEMVKTILYTDRDERFWAISSNVSPSGIGIFTNRPLEQGQEIKVTSKHLWTEPKIARVAWSFQLNTRLYKAGIALN